LDLIGDFTSLIDGHLWGNLLRALKRQKHCLIHTLPLRPDIESFSTESLLLILPTQPLGYIPEEMNDAFAVSLLSDDDLLFKGCCPLSLTFSPLFTVSGNFLQRPEDRVSEEVCEFGYRKVTKQLQKESKPKGSNLHCGK
jgi:hypothetical protein